MQVDLQDLSRRLFQTANQLWTNTALRPDQYAQPVLALIALRQMEAKFDVVQADLAKTFTGRLKPTPGDYQGRGAVFLPDHARFSDLLGLPETENLAEALNEAMKGIAEYNPDLAGVMPQGYGSLPNSVLRELLRLLAPLKIEGDAYGLIFEYFMGEFASAFMQKGGEYFTPNSIVKLIVEVIEPYHGKIFDPACGSGGMFVHSAEFVRRHHKNPSREISVYGIEKMEDTQRCVASTSQSTGSRATCEWPTPIMRTRTGWSASSTSSWRTRRSTSRRSIGIGWSTRLGRSMLGSRSGSPKSTMPTTFGSGCSTPP